MRRGVHLIIVVLLVGCAAATPTEQPVDSLTPTIAPTATPSGEPLRVGVMLDSAGALALFSEEMFNGLQVGFEFATNDTMVIANRPVEFLVGLEDEEAARSLIEQGAEILVGAASSEDALAIQAVAAEEEVLYFVAPAASPTITGSNFDIHTFRVCRHAGQDALALEPWMQANIGPTLAILAESTPYGQAIASAISLRVAQAEEREIRPVFAPIDVEDYASFVRQALTDNPDGLILIWSDFASAERVFATVDELAGDLPVITHFTSNDLITLFHPGFEGALGFISYHHTLTDSPANVELVTRHLEAFGEPPDLFSECGFATAQAMVAALQATVGDTSPEALIPVLEGMTFEGPKGTYTIRAEDHQSLSHGYIVRLVDVDAEDDAFFELLAVVDAEEIAPPITVEREEDAP